MTRLFNIIPNVVLEVWSLGVTKTNLDPKYPMYRSTWCVGSFDLSSRQAAPQVVAPLHTSSRGISAVALRRTVDKGVDPHGLAPPRALP